MRRCWVVQLLRNLLPASIEKEPVRFELKRSGSGAVLCCLLLWRKPLKAPLFNFRGQSLSKTRRNAQRCDDYSANHKDSNRRAVENHSRLLTLAFLFDAEAKPVLIIFSSGTGSR